MSSRKYVARVLLQTERTVITHNLVQGTSMSFSLRHQHERNTQVIVPC